MLIKSLEADIKELARKRDITKVLFYTLTKIELEAFRKL